ncbi:hypothetical protein jhhlp_006918 [Lomentospora prolificans]|uniref:PHD-type domain-containing protein n=1 Tax=Lomentospora prolificans TaxID=41688 RepID=A0A2N3N351_9PEZI|nr:hypothetical protein jhhlp_006918 [Lomentospora prolificans]
MTTEAASALVSDEPISPRDKSQMGQSMGQSIGSINSTIDSMEIRADPDAQATVTDFLDFTEHLPSDVIRSLALIGKLDQTYVDASAKVNDLTTAWGQLPSLPPNARPSPVQLRADISENLRHAVNSRLYSHAEAVRMAENINKHYNRAKTIFTKLQDMLEHFPTAEEQQKSPVISVKSPQLSRTPKAAVGTTKDGQRVHRRRVPRVIVPGEVLAPYELDFNAYSDESDASSSGEEPDSPTKRPGSRGTPGPPARIKLVNKRQKTPASQRPPKPSSTRPPRAFTVNVPGSTTAAPIVLQPPPENAPPGSADAPWLQLTPYELARLRKRMKKNAVWNPSDTMIARELKTLGRGPEAYREAKKKAEEQGIPFESALPVPITGESGSKVLPEGAISVDALEEDLPVSNKGMKLNEAKKLKREAMAKLAVEEAEESERKFAEAARRFLGSGGGSSNAANAESSADGGNRGSNNRVKTRTSHKRKREGEGEPERPEENPGSETPAPGKRVKTETPVPPPQLTPHVGAQARSLTPIPPPVILPQSTTPVPIPIPRHPSDQSAKASTSPPATTAVSAMNTVVTTVPTKPPAEMPIHPPGFERGKSATPILPPVREQPRRETRQDTAKKLTHNPTQQPQIKEQTPQPQPPPQQQRQSSRQPSVPARASVSRGPTPAPEGRRPTSRGKAMSQEPSAASLAADRPRRSSTARNTPAPEQRQPGAAGAWAGAGTGTGTGTALGGGNKRAKRPAPGVVSTTSSGGNSAVGKRKAAPRKKARAQRKEKGQQIEVEMEEVDDEGNPIDPEEPRYCLCNGVSFGTMIQCDNTDNCKGEWFHLECVNLEDIPARTTKWYCPDCRVALNIGEKGEVNARGVKK